MYKETNCIRISSNLSQECRSQKLSVRQKALNLISLLSHRLQGIPESKRRCVNPDYSGLPGLSVSCTKKHLAQNKPK